jgi:dihydrofolate reductase
MRRILFFMMVSVDGYFEGEGQDISWHVVDEDFNAFAEEQLNAVDLLLFGRVTYEGMASYWPTAAAVADAPLIAEKMNSLPKLVFSRTLQKAEWNNTRIIRDNIADELTKLKEQSGKDMIIFGSSDLAVSLTELGLIDEYRIMVAPVVIGAGTTLFEGIGKRLPLNLVRSTTFRSGNVLLCYQPERTP